MSARKPFTRPSRPLLLLVLLLSLSFAGSARAQKGSVVALFAPEAPFAGPAQRFAFVNGVAKHLTRIVGQPFEAKAYKSATDFERDLKRKKIQYAIVGAVHLAGKQGLRVLAQARMRTKQDLRWSIMAKGKTSLKQLKGKRLQLPKLGRLIDALVRNGLLAGLYDINTYFKVQHAPGISSSVMAVRLGRADAVLAPVSTKGLTAVVPPLSLPPPAFVLADARQPKAMVAKVAKAVLSYGAAGATVVGWSAGKGSYGAVLSAARKTVPKMMLAPPPKARLKASVLFDTQSVSGELPRLEPLYWVP